ncbi:rRNA-binding ribosome biosynthesis protein [Collariella sp. IMI 366227]|nr:rRNA-binding ribosome biosynthesis protein [Collariella sp. IMI 366227]
MAKKRSKKRTHVGANNPVTPTAINGHANSRDPKSMVIRIGAGEVGTSVSQLAADVRRVMEPGTASRLRERKANRLRDYVTMCGPLGVTHLMLFSRSESGNTNLRLAVAPRGPTFHFRVEKYSLTKDIRKAQRHPKGGGKEYITPPLLVMNNFSTPDADANSKVPRHLESLATTAFQSLFPPINPQTTPLKSIRRVLCLNREQSDDGTFIVNFRHYAITTKSGKKGGLPNLGKLKDISEFMIGGEDGEGYMTDGTSGSEAETDAEVEILETATKRVHSGKARVAEQDSEDEEAGANDNVERRAVKLVELGPRMKLRMTKVEEGLCSGKIMWHEYVHKSKEELREMEKRWQQRKQEKEARKKQQKENVEKKRKAKADNKKAGGGGAEAESDDDEMDVDYDSDLYNDDGFDSEGLEGDAEELVNARMEEDGEWEDEEKEIANGKSSKRKSLKT